MDPTRWPLAGSRTTMRALIGLLIATMLAIGSGCAKQDWIDRTLVTVDVTRTWEGSLGSRNLVLDLEQQGSTVKGSLRVVGGGATPSFGGAMQGPVAGTVAGDVFRFRQTNGDLEGELAVSGDEMKGTVSFYGQQALSLRRVDPSSPPTSPPR